MMKKIDEIIDQVITTIALHLVYMIMSLIIILLIIVVGQKIRQIRMLGDEKQIRILQGNDHAQIDIMFLVRVRYLIFDLVVMMYFYILMLVIFMKVFIAVEILQLGHLIIIGMIMILP